MANDYKDSIGGSLRLKGASVSGGVKKKKKKNKAKEVLETVESVGEKSSRISGSAAGRKMTPAELSFKIMQEKRHAERILKKAAKSHKQQVEEFNSHLDKLSEHYDIPKVSWTK